ncbi:MAG: Beta-hexosaminidase A [Chlamydiia bacterium]|nr:Beta-hexosaminidase A [Chlamydiia bacterium]
MKFIYSILIFSSLFSLTTEEKVGQLIMSPIHGDQLDQQTIDFLRKTKIGGIILYKWTDNLLSKEKLKLFISDLQKESIQNTHLPLFIGIDQEGGRVQRLNMNLPSAQLMNLEGEDKVYDYASNIGDLLNTIGINLNFAPVVDINSNANNLIIKDRSFGNNSETVTAAAKAFSEGLILKNIFPCLKHFPGHGDVEADSHYNLPISNKTLDELMNMELKPYIALGGSIPFIMTAHILFPNIDPYYPATTSKIFLRDILRNKLAYDGLIICDSLRMEGILTKSLSKIAIDAFNAGNDILLVGGNRLLETDPGAKQINMDEIRQLHRDLVHAVNSGLISETKLNESVERILKLKREIRYVRE